PLAQRCLLTQHADDLADLLQSLDLNGVRRGGLSMGACTALQYHRLYGFERIRSYLHLDQSPCVRNSADWNHALLGATQQARLADWQTLMRKLEPYRGQPYARLPKTLRRALWAKLSEFFDFAFHHRGWKAVTRLARYELLIRRVAPTANWTIYLDSVRSY